MSNFATNNIIELLTKKLKSNGLDINDITSKKEGFSTLVEHIFNLLLEAERDEFLLNHNDSKNGYYSRSLNTALAKLNLNIPRTRSEHFYPENMLEKYTRSDDSYFQLMANLLINGKSKENIKSILSDFKLHFSEKVAKKIFKQIETKVQDFKSAQLPEKMPFVYIDAYHCRVKDVPSVENHSNGIVKDAAIYTVIGLGFEAKKQVLGFYIHFGHENKATWMKIFNDLVQRNLKQVMMFISDDFPGISDAIHSVFPTAVTQKCLVHFFRNCHRNLPTIDYILGKKRNTGNL